MHKRVLVAVVLVAVATFFVVSFSHASVLGWGNNYTIQKGDEIKSNLYVASDQLTIVGNVRGDVVGGGGNIFVNNTIGGSALLFGGTVNLLSKVSNNLRIAGGTIVVSGNIGGDLAAVGNNIKVIEGNNVSVGGDVLVAGNTIVISAPVNGSVKISGADVSIDSTVGGDARIIADKIHIGPRAVINGSLSYKSVREADISPSAKILGKTNFEKVKTTGPDSTLFSKLWDSFFFVKLIAIFVSAMILFAVGKNGMTTLSHRARMNPWQNLFAGIIFFIGAPISTVLLIVTVIGLPLSVAVFGLGIIFGIISIAFMPIFVGTLIKVWLKKGDSASWKAILLGSVVICVLGLIPVLGSIIKTTLFLISEGVMIRISLERLQKARS